MNSWYSKREETDREERVKIVNTALAVVREGIRITVYKITDYLDVTDFMKNTETEVPDSLHAFLNAVVQNNRENER